MEIDMEMEYYCIQLETIDPASKKSRMDAVKTYAWTWSLTKSTRPAAALEHCSTVVPVPSALHEISQRVSCWCEPLP